MPLSRRLATCVLLLSTSRATAQEAVPPRDYPVQPVPFTDVRIEGGFWGPRFETNRAVTLEANFRKCEETNRIANFARAGGLEEGPFTGIFYDDSDVFKVMEGAAYLLAQQHDPKLDAYLDDLIAKVAAAQEEDGYLYTARTLGATNEGTGPGRWSHLAHSHELYNVGHLYEAAVAHHLATGKRNLLDVAIKSADLVCTTFGPEPGQRVDVPGHEEIELGLVKLYRLTGDRRYLDQAKFFIDSRGNAATRQGLYGEYAQDQAPIVEQSEAVGHAVRGGYLYAGVADVAALTGDEGYLDAITRIWEDVVRRKLYLTGSVGQHGAGEGYAGPYKLSNLQAYNETCASIALALWNQRMFLLTGDGRYADVLERILYNGFLSGVSLHGDTFFYPNPLECDMAFQFNHGSLERSPWFGTSCCPTNVVRFMPSIAGYVYAVRDDDLYVNLYQQSRASIEVGGSTVGVSQETSYPWDDSVRLTIEPEAERAFAIRVRIPGWVRGEVLPGDLYRYLDPSPADWSIAINGEAVEPRVEQGYAVLDRMWSAGDRVDIHFELPIRRVQANELVEADRGKVAIERGPLVYCAEGADQEGGKVLDRILPDAALLTPTHDPGLLGGITTLTTTALRAERLDDGTIVANPVSLTLIPYYAWCHRGANEMAVWLPRTIEAATVPPPPTTASRSRASASHVWHLDSVDALNDQREPRSPSDHEVPRFTWWDHLGTTEWVQYDLPTASELSRVAVYWFDDSGVGQCRVPASWRVLRREGEAWVPVEVEAADEVARDQFNRMSFRPVVADSLRLEVELQPGFSGGILEWVVE